MEYRSNIFPSMYNTYLWSDVLFAESKGAFMNQIHYSNIILYCENLRNVKANPQIFIRRISHYAFSE